MLRILQAKQSVLTNSDYKGTITKLVTTEFVPAARAFKNKLQTIDENLFGAVAKGAVSVIGGQSLLQLFGGLPWPTLVPLAGTGATYVAQATINALLEARAAKRDCSISYILALD